MRTGSSQSEDSSRTMAQAPSADRAWLLRTAAMTSAPKTVSASTRKPQRAGGRSGSEAATATGSGVAGAARASTVDGTGGRQSQTRSSSLATAIAATVDANVARMEGTMTPAGSFEPNAARVATT